MKATRPGSARVAAFKDALRHGVVLTVLFAVAGSAVGGLLGYRLATTHAATMSVLVSPLDGNPFSTEGNGDDLVNLESEAQMVSSHDVTKKVQKRDGSNASLDDLQSGLTTDVPANTQIIKITYSSASPQTAVKRAQSFGKAFLANRESRAKARNSSQHKKQTQQVASRKREQKNIARKLNNAKDGSGHARVLRSQLDATTDEIERLRAKSAETQGASSDPGRIVTTAAIGKSGMFGSWIPYALVGLAGGLVIGLIIAAARSRWDKRVRHIEDLAVAGHTLLGTVPSSEAQQARAAFASTNYRLPVALRDLRMKILTAERRRPVVVALATTDPTGNLPVTAAGIALATSTSDLSTAVVEATGAQLPVHHDSGSLYSALAENGAIEDEMTQVNGHLRVLPPGGKDGEVDDGLFLSPRMRTVVERLRHTSEIVLLVGGNVQDAATRALIDLADSVILEVVEGISSYDDLYQVSADDSRLAPKLLGAVYLWHPSPETTAGRLRASSRKATGQPASSYNGASSRPPASAVVPEASKVPTTRLGDAHKIDPSANV